MKLRGFVRMMLGMQMMRMGKMSMMRGGFVVAVFVMRSGFMMVLRGVLVVFGGLFVVLVSGLMCHGDCYP
jgi:hypothetical protein